MNLQKERKAIDAALNQYRGWLDAIPEDLFTTTPASGGWSYAEVYSHILKATLASSTAIDKCLHSNTQTTTQGPTFWGKLLMFTGSFPPIKVKVPASVNEKMPALKIDKEEARTLIIKCRRQMDGLMAAMDGQTHTGRVKHPRLGMLNASQWFKFIRIHLQHHLKQLHRIKKVSNK